MGEISSKWNHIKSFFALFFITTIGAIVDMTVFFVSFIYFVHLLHFIYVSLALFIVFICFHFLTNAGKTQVNPRVQEITLSRQKQYVRHLSPNIRNLKEMNSALKKKKKNEK